MRVEDFIKVFKFLSATGRQNLVVEKIENDIITFANFEKMSFTELVKAYNENFGEEDNQARLTRLTYLDGNHLKTTPVCENFVKISS